MDWQALKTRSTAVKLGIVCLILVISGMQNANTTSTVVPLVTPAPQEQASQELAHLEQAWQATGRHVALCVLYQQDPVLAGDALHATTGISAAQVRRFLRTKC